MPAVTKPWAFASSTTWPVAARYALERHGLQARGQFVDFDVHHGNGTEDIVAGDERILMVSFFQHPFYPLWRSPRPRPATW